MWAFCLHSLFREYGWQFLKHVALPHPVKTTRAVLDSGFLDLSGSVTEVRGAGAGGGLENVHSIVGVGFCLKPMNPTCMSGRFNHDCYYLEHLLRGAKPDLPACCRHCAVREIGTMTLKTGTAFYIMTSAQDILFDLFKPALDHQVFSSGLFVICRYSLRPFAVGMLVSGVRGRLFTFESGDCRDYRTWLFADRGLKEERTEISGANQETITEFLAAATKEPSPYARFEKHGNILYPCC